MNIPPLSKTKTAKYAVLKTRKGRRKHSLFLAQGRKAVADTLNAFEPEALIFAEGASNEGFESYRDLTFQAPESDIRKISTLTDLPDMIAVYRMPQEETPEDTAVSSRDFSLVLDGVSDPGNFGTIIRTAHWFGIKEIFCSNECPDLYNPKVVQSTMGSLGKVRIIYCDLFELIGGNPEIPVYGLLLEGENLFRQTELAPGFIVMGNEGHGISEAVRGLIGHPLTIPPKDGDHPESLNVAIATAITISQIVK